MGRGQPELAYVAAIQTPKREIGLNQRTEHFEMGIVFQIGKVHRGRSLVIRMGCCQGSPR
ncbi:hypothetical protein NSPZN2_10768 [Nitrospira defluvii]|uniref:Transposase n=1 Tax=Nitrospira defluvii TaxID=330214 RepID=A0ABM8QK77_9BACT|nr:hypothetical protein NSPZN2_10768 [Nitrospira defluvii]